MYKIGNVVLIDDDDISNFLTAIVLKRAQVTQKINIFQDGYNALEWLQEKSHENKSQPNLILLDLNMPAMDGFEFLTAYRELRSLYNNSVVVVLTTSDSVDDHEHLKEFPEVEVYLNKPLTEDNLSYIMDKYFNPEFVPVYC